MCWIFMSWSTGLLAPSSDVIRYQCFGDPCCLYPLPKEGGSIGILLRCHNPEDHGMKLCFRENLIFRMLNTLTHHLVFVCLIFTPEWDRSYTSAAKRTWIWLLNWYAICWGLLELSVTETYCCDLWLFSLAYMILFYVGIRDYVSNFICIL
jgi:hypothetical protein